MRTRIKYIILGIIITILGFFLLFLITRKADASVQIPKVEICHFDGQSGNFQTLNIAIPAAIAHLAQHEPDYSGACQEEEEPVDVCSNIDGIQEVTPEGYTNENGKCCPPKEEEVDYCDTLEGIQAEDEDCPKECIPYDVAWVLSKGEEYCEEEEPVPTPVPTPTPPGNPPTFQGSTTDAPGVCPINNIGDVANIYVEVGIPNDGKLTVQWSLPENANQVHILYRQYDEDWKYALLNTLNDGNEEIGGLKNGVNYAFKVAGVRGCGVGNYSKEFDPKP